MTREHAITCPACAGEGEQHYAHASGRPDWDTTQECRECRGSGTVPADAFDAIVLELVAPCGEVDPAVLQHVSDHTGVSILSLEASVARAGAAL